LSPLGSKVLASRWPPSSAVSRRPCSRRRGARSPFLVCRRGARRPPACRGRARATLRRSRVGRARPGSAPRGGDHGVVRETTTKTYVAHLIAGDRSVVASPRSFNNRAGLARTVNEHLVPGPRYSWPRWEPMDRGRSRRSASGCSPMSLSSPRSDRPIWSASAPSTGRCRRGGDHLGGPRGRAQHRRRAARGTRAASWRDQKVVRVSERRERDVAVLEHAEGLELRLCGETSGVVVLAGVPIAHPIERGVRGGGGGRDRDRSRGVVRRLSSLPSVPNRLQRYKPRPVMSCSMTPSTRTGRCPTCPRCARIGGQ